MQAGKFGSRAQKIKAYVGIVLLLGCVSRNSDKSSGVQNADKASEAGDGFYCPSESSFKSEPRSCVTRGGFVIGPFPLELQERCREMFPSDSGTCVQRQDWPLEMFKKLASEFKNGCPLGTRPESGRLCVSSGFVYGPFLRSEVQACRKLTEQPDPASCEHLVWPIEVFRKVRDGFEVKKIVRVDEAPAAENRQMPTQSVQDSDLRPIIVLTPRPRDSAAVAMPTPAPMIMQDDFPKVSPAPTSEPAPVRTPMSTPTPETAPAQTPMATPTPGSTLVPKAKTPSTPAQAPSQVTGSSVQTETFVEAPTFCVYSWDERPGTADFTTRNSRLFSLGQPVTYRLDRDEPQTLLRSRDFQAMDVCMRARFLKKCFQRVILESDSPAAQKFRAWSLGRVRPVEAHMAFVMKESRLGLWPDECTRGRCKGIGLAKVTRGITPSGRTLPVNDTAWRGLTHNLITNLDFSLRLIVDKISRGPVDLYALAYLYHESQKTKERYAVDVDRYYKQLISCQLEER